MEETTVQTVPASAEPVFEYRSDYREHVRRTVALFPTSPWGRVHLISRALFSLAVLLFAACCTYYAFLFQDVFWGVLAAILVLLFVESVYLWIAQRRRKVKEAIRSTGDPNLQIRISFTDQQMITQVGNVTETDPYSRYGKLTEENGVYHLWLESAVALSFYKEGITLGDPEQLAAFLQSRIGKKAGIGPMTKRLIASTCFFAFVAVLMIVYVVVTVVQQQLI